MNPPPMNSLDIERETEVIQAIQTRVLLEFGRAVNIDTKKTRAYKAKKRRYRTRVETVDGAFLWESRATSRLHALNSALLMIPVTALPNVQKF